ncbi:hypothetical protein HYC85_022798 [Camellia sinensis]|uniref:Uncharacterized protein n=1 Tax=Camellia sinensis TaxID=4442 RepID=A0A7J7GCP9_CAMSI|nr:hypothetical protein HYC85_022798 [Camellia sinensis]
MIYDESKIDFLRFNPIGLLSHEHCLTPFPDSVIPDMRDKESEIQFNSTP